MIINAAIAITIAMQIHIVVELACGVGGLGVGSDVVPILIDDEM